MPARSNLLLCKACRNTENSCAQTGAVPFLSVRTGQNTPILLFLSSQNYKNPGAAFLKQKQPEAPGFSNRSIQFQHAGIQLIVSALKLKKLVMRTAFDNASVIEHHNRVRIAYS